MAELDQHDVVVDQPGLVVWVRDHQGRGDDLLVAVREPTVVVAQNDVHFAVVVERQRTWVRQDKEWESATSDCV